MDASSSEMMASSALSLAKVACAPVILRVTSCVSDRTYLRMMVMFRVTFSLDLGYIYGILRSRACARDVARHGLSATGLDYGYTRLHVKGYI